MAKNRFNLDNMLICSYAHLRSLEFKAYFKASKNLHFDGLPNKYSNLSMTRMHGNRYLMHAYNIETRDIDAYCIDSHTLIAERLDHKIEHIDVCFVDSQYMLMVRYA